ncbi:hypothetical protein SeLEV6574_g04725 [Synchytrium endobioticum]|uniref:Uncharacterized protein n=1 Tax=Synchytrium endobioticum TaxID=286115 RepID=A0A507CXX8_9FUNG|nr:hypothetical protein SeLEV6574_g04725 [Synchytrium endobioticum]
MSQSYNEFVWEGLRTLYDLAYLFVDEVYRGKLAISENADRSYLISIEGPRVSSELNVDEKLARLTEMDEDTVRELKRDFVDILAFSQLAAGRIAPPASSQVDFRKVKDIPDYVISLFHLLPPPENVPPKYLDLAATYHFLNWKRGPFVEGDHDQEFELLLGDAGHLYSAYDGAASAACSSQSAGSTEHGSWAARLLVDANKLRHAYATAVDARHRLYAESLREYRYGMTDDKKVELMERLIRIYPRWKDPNDPYGKEFTSITGLLIDGIIPDSIPVTETTLWEPVEGNSQSHNEFVWEVLDTLCPFTYLGTYCEVEDVHWRKLWQDLRVWMLKRQDQLETQIRLSMGGSHGFFADSPEDGFDMLDLHDRIATVNEALKSDTIPVISSLTQNGTAFPGASASTSKSHCA